MMMLHTPQPQSPSPPPPPPPPPPAFATQTPTPPTTTTPATQAVDNSPIHAGRKRKAETQENERLSKRLSLLNLGTTNPQRQILPPSDPQHHHHHHHYHHRTANTPRAEQNGSKLYVPVENPSVAAPRSDSSNGSTSRVHASSAAAADENHTGDDMMHLDDSKYKVYIYNLDDELSSDDDTASADDGRLVFLPDIEKHLRANRIPPHVLTNGEGELAGMQMVLYSDPKSLTVPEEKDSVRRIIIEARNRARENQRQEMAGAGAPVSSGPAAVEDDTEAMDLD
ncbi:hypothetical protein ACRE_036950 [Hapsidospora chrysogenum ATCC 11550]|uniref:Uncharacterized protein n=1 Tax=Hapsidospora chrysogenum (strain ATCC 11550 / CBS 779.69 / DSM 880 / IAM 14645 / JCM 23072 / IMI 49137) TaxID=857340 RepID=A0A086T7Y6_HAPC1|nr:hypothetical protein ACRE_036950 [Hapsidospora chrysogenum ATCC 11550]